MAATSLIAQTNSFLPALQSAWCAPTKAKTQWLKNHTTNHQLRRQSLTGIKQDEIQIKVSKNTPTGQSEILAPGDIGTSGVDGETIKIITNKLPTGETWYIRSIQTRNRISWLGNIDTLRDIILQTPGNTELDISTANEYRSKWPACFNNYFSAHFF